MSETSTNNLLLKHNEAAVLQHMAMYQDIISRMGSNSFACKNWCIVLISAFLAFVVKSDQDNAAIIGFIPITLFWFLDGYYLSLERMFREAANESVNKIHHHNFYLADLFVVKVNGKLPEQIKKGLFSWATWPMYACLVVMLLLAMQYTGISVVGEV